MSPEKSTPPSSDSSKGKNNRQPSGLVRVNLGAELVEKLKSGLREFHEKHGFVLYPDGFVKRVFLKYWEEELKALQDGKLKA